MPWSAFFSDSFLELIYYLKWKCLKAKSWNIGGVRTWKKLRIYSCCCCYCRNRKHSPNICVKRSPWLDENPCPFQFHIPDCPGNAPKMGNRYQAFSFTLQPNIMRTSECHVFRVKTSIESQREPSQERWYGPSLILLFI